MLVDEIENTATGQFSNRYYLVEYSTGEQALLGDGLSDIDLHEMGLGELTRMSMQAYHGDPGMFDPPDLPEDLFTWNEFEEVEKLQIAAFEPGSVLVLQDSRTGEYKSYTIDEVVAFAKPRTWDILHSLKFHR